MCSIWLLALWFKLYYIYTLILECKFIRAGRIHRERFKQAFSTRWKFTYLEFSTCSTCLHQKKSYVVVRIIDLLMTLMTSVRGVHYIRTVTPILGHGSVKVSEHFSTTGHIIDWENTNVLDREDREYPRQVREAIYIKKIFDLCSIMLILQGIKANG